MKVLEVKNLKKYFKEIKAVDGISFSISNSEIFGFLGPNGAGKTTTIRSIMNLINPTDGEIKLFDKDFKDFRIKRDVGYLPAESVLNETWTGSEHLKMIQSIQGEGKSDKHILDTLKPDLKTKIRDLSTGNKQKLGFVLAMVCDPKLVILDEPTRGMDPLVQNDVHKILLEFQQNGGSVFLSSHDLTEVERLCNRIGIIRQGKLVTVESIDTIRKKKIYSVVIDFKEGYNKEDFNIPNTEIQTKTNNSITLRVKEDINPMVSILQKYKLSNLLIRQADLEDIFLEFYKN